MCSIILIRKAQIVSLKRRYVDLNKELIAIRLKSLREDKNREDVAADLKISLSALQMYENGQRIPRDEIKIRIAKYYGLTVQEIFFNM